MDRMNYLSTYEPNRSGNEPLSSNADSRELDDDSNDKYPVCCIS